MSYQTTNYLFNKTDIGSYFCDLSNDQDISGTKTFKNIPYITAVLNKDTDDTSIATTSFVKSQNYLDNTSDLQASNLKGIIPSDVSATTQLLSNNSDLIATTSFVKSLVQRLLFYCKGEITNLGSGPSYSNYTLSTVSDFPVTINTNTTLKNQGNGPFLHTVILKINTRITSTDNNWYIIFKEIKNQSFNSPDVTLTYANDQMTVSISTNTESSYITYPLSFSLRYFYIGKIE